MMHKGMLYKTNKFCNPIYVGDPINTVKIFSAFKSDELFLVDIDCSKNQTEPNFKMLETVSKYAKMPICYGGGIKNLSQIKRILSLGYEKVLISSAGLIDHSFINNAVQEFGGQSIVACIDIKYDNLAKKFKAYTINGMIECRSPLDSILEMFMDSGVGEILINSIDRDGTRLGYDIELSKIIASKINVPLHFLGGAGKIDHLTDLLKIEGVHAAAAGTLWTFMESYNSVLINYLTIDKRLENNIFYP